MILTTEQERAADVIRHFITTDDFGKQTLVLHGLAGTGKTTVLTAIANEFTDAKLCAFTGKAASVLRAKSGLNACTVHSLFYKLLDKGTDEKTGKRILYFRRVHGENAMRGKVILLDECSMIDGKTANDLIQSGAKIVAVGDPGQLPPVHGATFFNQPDITLTQIHRQALESPIIRQAHAVRDGGAYHQDTADFQVVRNASNEQIMEAGTILCWRNVTRHKVNAKMRSLLGYNLPYPQAGETVLCLKNAHRYGIFNGVTYELARNFEPDDENIFLMMDGVEVEVPNCVFVEKGGSLDDYDDDDFVSAFDFGYCLTVHKSQGSEWDKVLLIDENHKHERRRWLYTAISRAAKSIIVQQ
jgi:exodeoxyribonuclease-5